MDLATKPFCRQSHHPLPLFLSSISSAMWEVWQSRLQLVLLLFLIPSAKPISDYNTLVYKQCANQTFTSTSTPAKSPPTQQTLSSLFQELIAHSSQSKFFKHIEPGDNGETGISGLFQCIEDISNEDCHSCVSTLPDLSNTLCKESVSARVQLHGCYMHYELDGVNPEPSKSKLMHKTCGEILNQVAGGGFEEMRDAAFAALESGVVNGDGFYKTSYDAILVMAECVGGLGGCECRECVRSAEAECGAAVSGQIYLDECFLSYAYDPADHISDHPHPERRRDGGGSNGKSVAIVVGGAAALFFGFIFLLFVKSWSKKEDD